MTARLVAALLSIAGITLCQTTFPPQPDAAEQQKTLMDASRYAISHEENLPNFICSQITGRFENFNNSGWRPIDRIVEHLAYIDPRQLNEALKADNQPSPTAYDQLVTAPGEFGSVMRTIFLPETEAEFTWQEWFTLRGKRMHVFAYQVHAFKSHYHIEVPEQSVDLAGAYHGLIFIDGENHFVHRITLLTDGIPQLFPIQDIDLTLDYDYARIGDAEYLLPLQFVLRSRQGDRLVENDVKYENYGKVGTVSAISFNSTEAIQQ